MFRRVIRFFWNRRVEQDLDAELQSTVELLAAEHIRAGASPQDALRLARLELGGIEQVKEEVRSARGLAALDSLIRDLRHALRDLIRAPGFSLSVAVTLGLALGANAAVLSLLDKLILRPLPVSEPSRLVAVSAPPLPVRGRRPESVEVVEMVTANGRASLSYPLYAALRSRVRAFAGMLAKTHAAAILMAEETPVAVNGVLVTGNYFEVLGVKAAIGRVLTPGDDEPGTPVVVLSHGFWQRQFGGDPSILYRTIRLNLLPMTVVGVTAPGFSGTNAGETVDFFSTLSTARALLELPAVVKARFRFDSPDYHIYSAMARLAPGMDLKQAEQAANQVYQQLITEALGHASRGSFAQNHVQLFPGGYASSNQSGAQPGFTYAAPAAHGHGRAGAGDRGRQCGESVSRARRSPVPRDRHPLCARSQPLASPPRSSRGVPLADLDRRERRPASGALDRRPGARRAQHRETAGRSDAGARLPYWCSGPVVVLSGWIRHLGRIRAASRWTRRRNHLRIADPNRRLPCAALAPLASGGASGPVHCASLRVGNALS